MNSKKKIFLPQLLPSSALQKRPFAKEIQNLIACRLSAQTYSQKSPNLSTKRAQNPFWIPRKKIHFSIPCSRSLVVQGCKWIARKNTFGVLLVLVVARTNILTHRNFLHTNIFKHRFFYTEILSKQKHFWTESLPDTDIFAYEHIYTQSFFHTKAFIHRNIYTHRDFRT